ncbi:hypothetical protein GH714_011240 [Hevea brasiliensis]|uniref:NAC domain-containing protein n=1 Tax=Hevea brasiliensis TaxID=3981 RepID=A0A6A6LIA7_HEVBR|nr:hypothetical protein GH714_011240 [Hevea brasiliensis]
MDARTSHFFQWVGSLCGEFISLDGVTLAKSRFDYARVLILTDSTEFINKIIQVDIDHVKFNIRATEEPCHELFSPPISNNERRLSLSESSDADVDSENNPIGASGKRNENKSIHIKERKWRETEFQYFYVSLHQSSREKIPRKSPIMEVTQPQSNASVTATRQPRTDPINDNNRKNFIDIDYFNSFPPGYRFRPLDGELVVHYLRNKIANQPLPPNKIMEVKLYEYNPEKLAVEYWQCGEKEWYFFTPRDKKYPNGSRPKRDAGGGYWKATGADKAVKYKGAVVGYRKALVFYMGKPPNGTKTNWIMHEYRLDNWVLCRIYKRDAKDNLRSRLSNEEQSAELDDQTADVVRDVDKNSDPPAYTNALNDNKQIVSIPIQENPSAFYENPPYVPINNYDHHQAMLEAANYQRAMFAAANYGSYPTYATGMTSPMPEPVQIYPPEDIQIHPTEDIVSKYLNENSCEFELSPDDWDIISNCLL